MDGSRCAASSVFRNAHLETHARTYTEESWRALQSKQALFAQIQVGRYRISTSFTRRPEVVVEWDSPAAWAFVNESIFPEAKDPIEFSPAPFTKLAL